MSAWKMEEQQSKALIVLFLVLRERKDHYIMKKEPIFRVAGPHKGS